MNRVKVQLGRVFFDLRCLVSGVLILNVADYIVTAYAVARGATEMNPLVIFLGGPTAPLTTIVKLGVAPVILTWLTWKAHRDDIDSKLPALALIVSIILLTILIIHSTIEIQKLSDMCML